MLVLRNAHFVFNKFHSWVFW